MTNLRYLKIYNKSRGNTCNVYFPDGLEWISDKLRYLRWEGYCLEYLPSTFCAEMLIELHLSHSKLKKLWDGVQNLVNLNILWLESSKNLIEIPDLSKATNLHRVYLFQCESLGQLHPSIFSLPDLRYLDLRDCKKIESLKTNIHSKSLRELLLDGCASLTEFSVTSDEMTELTLGGTAIRELSSSIWRNRKLTSLGLSECNKLNIVGNKLTNDHGLGSVTELDLLGCTEINALSLWSILDGIQSLKWLSLHECCNMECLPENIQNHSMLKSLALDDCRKLVSVTELPPSLLSLSAINCTYLDTDSTQRSFLENMVQIFSKYPFHANEHDDFYFSILPGAQVPRKFDFQTIKASITIPPIPKYNLSGFIFCTILSKGFHICNHPLHCVIFENGKEVETCFTFACNYIGTLISDHVLISDHDVNEELWWSTEGIKGCGVLPVYNLEHKSDLDGREIGKLKFSAQYSGGQENYNELQPSAIGGEVISSNNEKEGLTSQLC
ncbi:disease resistance protein RPP4-like [Medicago truncatula]|uniref:disease resistance protein RPP4-like n=1 Tax=Medicago truncatula TaxID=3880 RepID=UPI001966DA37|nr:disease resistance protein RPP4-like [Medicago truncatula]